MRFSHGLCRKVPEYGVWKSMRQRCNDSNHHKFKDYGARGIMVCKRWDNFRNFYEDMGPRPSPQYSIERKNNNGDYTPENCRWATRLEQANNKRSNRLIQFNSQTKTVTAWAQRLGINESTLRERLSKWTIRRALTSKAIYNGKTPD